MLEDNMKDDSFISSPVLDKDTGKLEVLRVLVGSRAHGLDKPDSDFDYRTVFAYPTSKIVSVGYHIKGKQWVEGIKDITGWEIGHFLHLATKCNPTALETLLAPVQQDEDKDIPKICDDIRLDFQKDLRSLFPFIWNTNDAFNAFTGYAHNQQKKMLMRKDKKERKFAIAYIRTLWNLVELLNEGIFSVCIKNTPIFKTLKHFRDDNFTLGEVIDEAERLTFLAEEARTKHGDKKANLDMANKCLLKIRRTYWDMNEFLGVYETRKTNG